MKKTFQIRKGFDGLFYFRDMSGDCKWSSGGFPTRDEAESFILDPENGRGDEEIELQD